MANSAYKYLYGKRWQRLRLVHLRKWPLCVRCYGRGMTIEADVVDHVKAHKGNTALFWGRNNWQSLCYSCHNSDKQSEERREALAPPMRGLDGYPVEGEW